MKIVFVVHSLSGGGAERQLSYFLNSLKDTKIDAHVIYRSEGPLGKHIESHNIRYLKLNSKGNYNFLALIEICGILKRIKPDIVQTWIVQSDILVGIIRLGWRFSWVVREANAGNNYEGFKNATLRKWLLRFADLIVSNSPQGFDFWNAHYRSKFIPNGFEKKDLMNLVINNDILSKMETDKYILYVGRLAKHKNVDVLIKGFAKSELYSNYSLVICGKGPEKEKLKSIVDCEGLSKKVRIIGFQPKHVVESIINEASLLCLFSDYEGMPNVVLESMQVKTPVLLSPSKSHKAIFDEECVTFINSITEEAVSEALVESLVIIEGPSKAESAQGFVSELSIENMSKSYLDAYDDILKNQK